MVGLVPTIDVFASIGEGVFRTWMLATRASMTATHFPRVKSRLPRAATCPYSHSYANDLGHVTTIAIKGASPRPDEP
jgi:hypothetical protein